MNYKLQYEKLIQRGKNRKLDCYKEVHHIKPKCLGGNDDKINLVELTAREHFIAHILLVKMYPKEYGLIKAVNMMCTSSDNQERIGNRMYGWLKEKLSVEMSRMNKGSSNSQHGTMWISNLDLKESKKIPKEEIIPNGWVKGRNVWIQLDKKRVKKELKETKRLEKLKLKSVSTICPMCNGLFDGKLKYCSVKCKKDAKVIFVNSDRFVSNKGFKHSEETKKIISEKSKSQIRG